VTRAGDAATVVPVAPMRIPSYLAILDSEPDAKWPRSVAGRYLIPGGPGIRGSQEYKPSKSVDRLAVQQRW
jgi:hypothetical protein